ncbi:protein pellino [Trichonephila clavata]|uniref:Protein pellino n=1 Tax=Trichonephila clavata TaxID=2740835 RepID=A0A8X6GNE3_TRICU|nr:protein pellino [Trichonephila clavata]
MFMQKVLNWIVPLQETEGHLRNDEEDITSIDGGINETSYKFAKANTPSYGTLTSIMEPDRNPADSDCISESFESVEEMNFIKADDKPHLMGYIQSNDKCSKYPNVKNNNQPSNYLPDSGAGGDGLANYSIIVGCEDTVQYKNYSSVKSSKMRKNISVQTSPKKRQNAGHIPPLQQSECPLIRISPTKEKKNQLSTKIMSSKYFFRETELDRSGTPDSSVYGALVVLGCNSFAFQNLLRLMKSKYVLRKRYQPNGVKESFSFVTSRREPLSRSPSAHTVSYNVSNTRSVVVEYTRDNSTDMFQIGRYESSPVDFRVLDVNRKRNGVSRFACRIIIQRNGDRQAKVYAAAFDVTGNIFLGEGALICMREGKMDGFTTNGILIKHPNSQWREVSVCGYIYPVRSPNVEFKKRPRIVEETNVLQDGTLIDLCGVTLVWRTPEGLRKAPCEESLKRIENSFHEFAVECELLVPDVLPDGRERTFIFMACGHIIRLSVSTNNLEGWSCPVCRCIGPITELKVGKEPAFYVDNDCPTHAFKPCGHVTNLGTVQYWSAVKIPEHRNIQETRCPFCATKLNSISNYIELKFPE